MNCRRRRCTRLIVAIALGVAMLMLIRARSCIGPHRENISARSDDRHPLPASRPGAHQTDPTESTGTSIEEQDPTDQSATPQVSAFGTVRWSSGGIVPHARLQLIGDKRVEVSAEADPAGDYLVALPAMHEVLILAYAGNGNLWSSSKHALSSGLNRIDLEIGAPAELEILATDRANRPIPARVRLINPFPPGRYPPGVDLTSQTYQCDETGRLTLKNLAPISSQSPFRIEKASTSDYWIMISSPQHRVASVRKELQPGYNFLAVTLEDAPPDIRIRGIVLMPDGRRAPGALVQWTYHRPSARHGPGEGVSTSTDGSFEIDYRSTQLVFDPSGRAIGHLSLRAWLTECAESFVDIDDPTPGKTYEGIVLRLGLGHALFGCVLDDRGNRVPGATVTADRVASYGDWGAEQLDRTAEDGTFKFLMPATGRYRFSAEKEGFRPREDAGKNLATAEFELPGDYLSLVLEECPGGE